MIKLGQKQSHTEAIKLVQAYQGNSINDEHNADQLTFGVTDWSRGEKLCLNN